MLQTVEKNKEMHGVSVESMERMTYEDIMTLRRSIDNAEREFGIFKAKMIDSLKTMQQDL